LINNYRKIGYIVGFSTIFLIFSSNLINNQNYLSANPLVNKVSLNQVDRNMVIPVKDTKEDLGIPFTSNPNPEQLKNGLCDNKVIDSLGIPLCNPLEKTEDKSTKNNDNDDGNNDADKEEEKKLLEQQQEEEKEENKAKEQQLLEQQQEENKAKEQQLLEQQQQEKKAKDGNNGDYEGDNKQGSNDETNTDKDEDKKLSEQQQLLEQQQENKAKDGNDGNYEEDLKIAGSDPKLEKKQTQVNKKIDKLDKNIENLKDKIVTGEDNQRLLEQQEENKAKDGNDGNYEEDLKIAGLDLKIQKIQANLDKKIEKLKDKIQNDKDNQLLIEQRDDDDDDDGGNKDDGDHETYDGYGFDGGNDDGNDNDDKNFNFATAGDFGCSKNTQNTVANMEKKEPELVLALGDLSYHSTADCWFDTMSPLKGKMMITLGSHDTNDGQAKFNQYVKSFELDKPYYSYDYKNVHFLVMASLSDFKERSEQYNFIEQDLEKASQNKDINWIIVSTYKPLYTSPSEHKAEGELRELYHPLFEKYGVDLVLGGHNHNYQRTYPLTFNPDKSSKPTTTNGVTTDYNSNKDGIVFATVGTGGVNLYGLDGKEPYMATQFTSKFGFLNIDINNGNPDTKLTGTFYDNKGNNVLDEFTIEKEIKNKNKNSEVNYT